MKVLVTGGCGFVGRHLVKRLKNDGHNVTVVDNLSTGKKIEDWPNHLKCNVDRVIYRDCVDFFEENEENFEVVFHLAAVVEGRLTIENEPLKVAKDLIIDSSMFQWAVRTKPNKIVYFSSSAVYPINMQSKEHNIALYEGLVDFKKNVIGVPDMTYGYSKMTGEFLANMVVEKHGLKVAVYRPFSGYGEDQEETYPFPSLIRKILNSRGDVEVWGSGKQSRDFVYIEDAITAILQTYQEINDASAVNLGTGIKTTFEEFITIASNVLGKQIKIKKLKNKPEGVFSRYANTKKQEELGIKMPTALEEGISIVAKYKANSE